MTRLKLKMLVSHPAFFIVPIINQMKKAKMKRVFLRSY